MNLDMPYVMDQCTEYAKVWEKLSGADCRRLAEGWRRERWKRLDREIEWAKSRQWVTLNG